MIEMYKKDLSLQQLVGYFKETFKLVLPFQLLNILKQLRREQPADYVVLGRKTIVFPPAIKEAIHIMIAVDIFKSLCDQGLLTEEEFKEFELEGKKRWNDVLNDDTMSANRVVIGG